MSAEILGISCACDQCRSMAQYSLRQSPETRRLVRTDSPGRPPWLSHSSRTMCLHIKHKKKSVYTVYLPRVWNNGTLICLAVTHCCPRSLQHPNPIVQYNNHPVTWWIYCYYESNTDKKTKKNLTRIICTWHIHKTKTKSSGILSMMSY